MIRVSGQSKSRPVKAAGAEVGAQRRKPKLHAAVAKNTFGSKNAQKLTVSEHFLKLWCRKIARRCGEKHIVKSKCTKHVSFGALFEVQMSKNCTPLWRNTHLEVKMLKNCRSRSTFWSSDVEKMHAAVAKHTFGSENVKKTVVLGALFEVQMLKKCTPLWRNTHLEVNMLKNCRSRSTFWSSDVEKMHAAVAKHTFGSENVKKTVVLGALFEVQMLKKCRPLWRNTHLEVKMLKKLSFLEHFLKFGCRKIGQVVS